MKNLFTICAVPVLAVGFAAGQQNPPTTSTDANNPQTARAEDVQRPVDRRPDYGWIGLLGLAGLLGLKRRERDVRVDRTVVSTDRTPQNVRRAG